jgi:glutathione S-transferase
MTVGQALYMARHFARTAPFAALDGWYGRISAHPGFRAALPPAGADLLYKREFYEPWTEVRHG